MQMEHGHRAPRQGLSGATGEIGEQQPITDFPFFPLTCGNFCCIQVDLIVVLGVRQLGFFPEFRLFRSDARWSGFVQNPNKPGHIGQGSVRQDVLLSFSAHNLRLYRTEEGICKNKVRCVTRIIITGAGLRQGQLQFSPGGDLRNRISQLLLGSGMVGVNGVQSRRPVGSDGQIDLEGLRQIRRCFQDAPQHLLPAGRGPAVLPRIKLRVLRHHGDLHAAKACFINGSHMVFNPAEIRSCVREPAAEHPSAVHAGLLEFV